jgi:PAS domain S-box-containing protein
MFDFQARAGQDLLPPHLLLLRRQFLDKLPARMGEVQTLWAQWTTADTDDARACEALHQCVHKLSGSAGTFGLSEVSLMARELEQGLFTALRNGTCADAAADGQLGQTHQRLQALARSACASSLAVAEAQPNLDGPKPANQRPAGAEQQEPWRVLLVDDDQMLLEAHAAVLLGAGMEVLTLCQPELVLATVRSFKPDVLLLDVYMPGTSGPELAAALRREESLLHLPILFLSGETDLTQQLLALSLGGDDFLIKPLQPQHLVAAVGARASRARQILAVQRRLETTLYEREREHLALDHHAMVTIADQTGVITYANALFCRTSGFTASELQGQTFQQLLGAQADASFVQSVWTLLKAGQVWRGEIGGHRKDGGLCWLESTVTPFFDANGRIYQVVAIQTDITHIKAAEVALRRQRDMQRVISVAAAALMGASYEQTGAAIDAALGESGSQLGADRAYLFTFSSDAQLMRGRRIWNAPGISVDTEAMLEAELDGTPWMRERFLREGVVSVADVLALPDEAAADRALLQSRGIRALLVLSVQKDGLPFGFIGYSASSNPREWMADEIELLKVLADVMGGSMARRRAEVALRTSEARLNFLVASSPVTIYTVQAAPPHVLTYLSPNVSELTALDPKAWWREPDRLIQAVHAEDRERMRQHWPAVLAQGQHAAEYRLDAGNGQHRWLQDQCLLVRDGNGVPTELIGYWMDIDSRKCAENGLALLNQELEHRVEAQTRSVMESERFAHATLDAMSAGVVILDQRGVILAANRSWRSLGDKDLVREGGNYLLHCERTGADALPAGPALAAGIRSVICGGLPSFLCEYSDHLPREQRWFVCRAERFPGEGEVRVVVSHENITQMKLVERQQLRSQRLESLGTLAGDVAHDLNNALAPILMGMGMLKEQFPQEARLFELMHGSARRGADMVRQLLTFARGVEGDRVPVQVSRLIQEIESLVQGSFPKNIQLLLDCESDVPLVVGDATQLHQILLNLCLNARDAMPEGGLIAIKVRRVEIDAVYARAIENARPGSYVLLRVSDTGSGIEPEILDRIFDPFFTTKAADRGTGLGLSTLLGLVKSHGGFLQVYSQPGQGSTFAVYLPAALSGEAPTLQPEDVDGWRGQGETVVFVDDEAAVREVGRSVLERLNLRAVLATDGADALIQIEAHRCEVRVVITDLHMPHVDGLALVLALRRTFPSLPVVLASGRVDESVSKAMEALGVVARLDKPFTEVQLSRVLRALLRNGSERQAR